MWLLSCLLVDRVWQVCMVSSKVPASAVGAGYRAPATHAGTHACNALDAETGSTCVRVCSALTGLPVSK